MVKKKTEIEAPANAALQASITPVGIEFGMNKLRLGDLNDSQTELISSGQRGRALMKVGRQAAKVRFVLSDERLEMFGRGGGR